MARPDLARRQRARAEAFAATDPRLDFTVESLAVLAGREESSDALAYVGEVLRGAIDDGEWDRLDDGTPAITWAGGTFDLRGLDGPGVREIVEHRRPPTPPAARRSKVTAPLLALYALAMIGLVWWFAGVTAALVGIAFGLGFAVIRRWVQPRAR